MKRGSTTFLQAVILLLGVGVFAFLLWEQIKKKFYNTEKPSNAIPVTIFENSSWIIEVYEKMVKFGPVITLTALVIYILILIRRHNR